MQLFHNHRSQSSGDVDGNKDGDTSSRDKETTSPIATSPEKKQKLDPESQSNTTTQKPPGTIIIMLANALS